MDVHLCVCNAENAWFPRREKKIKILASFCLGNERDWVNQIPLLDEIGRIGLNPYVKEVDLAGFQGASWAVPLKICVRIFSSLGIGPG